MEMQGEAHIPAPRQVVWEALNDPEALKESIAGCEELTRDGENSFAAKVRAKVGPVSARFAGRVELKDIDPPNGYRIQGEGAGGAAGFAKGGAQVRLEDDGQGGTILKYDVDANVGGKLAQIGSRLIDGAARKMADEFFTKFSEVAVARAAGVASAVSVAPAPQNVVPPSEEASGKASEELSEPPPPPPVESVRSAAEAQVAEDALVEGDRPLPRTQPTGGTPSLMWLAGIGLALAMLIYIFF